MARPTGIPKAAPLTTLAAYGRVMDLSEAVAALRIAAQSDLHELRLPGEAVAKLVEAHQALLAAHRVIEASLVDCPCPVFAGESKSSPKLKHELACPRRPK